MGKSACNGLYLAQAMATIIITEASKDVVRYCLDILSRYHEEMGSIIAMATICLVIIPVD